MYIERANHVKVVKITRFNKNVSKTWRPNFNPRQVSTGISLNGDKARHKKVIPVNLRSKHMLIVWC